MDIVEELRDDNRCRCFSDGSEAHHCLTCRAADEIERMRDALKLIALRNHPVTLSENTDWYEVADCMVGIARKGLGEKSGYELMFQQESGSSHEPR